MPIIMLTGRKDEADRVMGLELAAFLAAPQRVLSREQVLDLSRLHNDEVYDRAIDVQVGRLRRKIESPGSRQQLIRTERGAGYVLTAAVETVR